MKYEEYERRVLLEHAEVFQPDLSDAVTAQCRGSHINLQRATLTQVCPGIKMSAPTNEQADGSISAFLYSQLNKVLKSAHTNKVKLESSLLQLHSRLAGLPRQILISQ